MLDGGNVEAHLMAQWVYWAGVCLSSAVVLYEYNKLPSRRAPSDSDYPGSEQNKCEKAHRNAIRLMSEMYCNEGE